MNTYNSRRNGNLLILAFSATLWVCGTASSLNAAGTLTNIYSFGPLPGGDGYEPFARLTQGHDGNFYGTAYSGGSGVNGTVFRITTTGVFTNLHLFTGTFVAGDGSHPYAELLLANDGNFYGTTIGGGTGGNGTVFRISPNGNFTNIFSFVSGLGAEPYGGLVQGNDGNLYGTTYTGVGYVFRMDLNGGNFTNLYAFSSTNGNFPHAGLLKASDGNFYGTTEQGGTNGWNAGTVFRITPGGSFTTLYTFSGPDGSSPEAGLVEGRDGNLYGTTKSGGTPTLTSVGTVFKISPGGNFTNLYSFNLSTNIGGSPFGGLVLGSDGNFYGTTAGGGISNAGTIFQITPDGNLTTLYSFTGPGVIGVGTLDGSQPYDALVQGIDGNFYGTTLTGGTNNLGAIFKFAAPLSTPANQIGSLQITNTNIIMSISSVAGATYQLQYRDSPTNGNWTNDAGIAPKGIGGPLTLTNVGGLSSSKRYYRLLVSP